MECFGPYASNVFMQKLTRLRRDLKATAISLSTQASTLWLQKLAQGGPLEAGSNPLEPLIQRLAELREGNLQLCESTADPTPTPRSVESAESLPSAATEISELNMRAGGLPGELQALRERGRGLSEDVRSVEEEVEVMRGEKEREARSKVADLQTEAIRLKRELEVRSPHTSPFSHCHHHTLPTLSTCRPAIGSTVPRAPSCSPRRRR